MPCRWRARTGTGAPAKIAAILGAFLLIDVSYFSANLVKIHDGGWFPLALGAGVFLLMTTWKRGRGLAPGAPGQRCPAARRIHPGRHGLGITLIPGTAVFMTPNPAIVPHALLHSLKHYKCLHERIVILTVDSLRRAARAPPQRVMVEPLNEQFITVQVFFGFMDEPNLPDALESVRRAGPASST